jgi:hypothetical protein
MLGKLLKYEFRATGRLYLPLYLVVLVFALLGRISINGNLLNITSTLNAYGGSFTIGGGEGFFSSLVSTAAALVLMGYFLTLLGAVVVHFIITIQRFWKNLMGDEGYLMFTLPVSVDELLWCKAIAASVWGLITTLVVLLSLLILAFQPWMMQALVGFFRSLGPDAAIFWEMMGLIFNRGFWILMLLALPVGTLEGLFFLYAAMAIGHTVRNHKVLASIGAYIGMSTLISIASSALMAAVTPLLGTDLVALDEAADAPELLAAMEVVGNFVNWTMVLSLVMSAVMAVVMYFVTRYLLNTQLNLE